MAFSDYSTTPSSNTSIAGTNIAEGCPAANVNNVIRQLAADGRALSDTVAAINVSGYMPLAGGVFTGPIHQVGAGQYTFWVSPSMTSGEKYIQPTASPLPTPGEGTTVYQY